jgi:ABC-type phosphate transport system substrate-binding protein
MKPRTALALLALLAAAAGSSAAPAFQVVVHPGVTVAQVSRKDLASIFLRKSDRWSSGVPAAPVDQSVRSTVRAAFSAEVLGMALLAVQEHWRAKIAAGATPPPVAASDQAVLARVASTPGAVGYVSEGTVLPATVRAITVVD